jgi:hypothetical protein
MVSLRRNAGVPPAVGEDLARAADGGRDGARFLHAERRGRRCSRTRSPRIGRGRCDGFDHVRM